MQNEKAKKNPNKLLSLLSLKSREKVYWVLNNKRVIKYVFKPSGREIWVVGGEGGDYLILGDYYCSCFDFYLESLVRVKRAYCYHLIAKKIAELKGNYRTYKLSDSEFEDILIELIKQAINTSK